MKVLFIGGTGNISTSVSKLAVQSGIDLWHINRGTLSNEKIDGVKTITADINNVDEVKKLLKHHTWDVVVNWIAFVPSHIKRDFELFADKTSQYIFISSASAYQKPLLHDIITESTPLKNPFWKYSRDKIDCEDLLNSLYRNHNFPITIVRPSHTYRNFVPSCFDSDHHYTLINRILQNKPIIVPGTGLSRWTLTHADDFAKGFVGLLGHSASIGHAFHITSDEKLTWNQIYNEIAQAVNCKPLLINIPPEFIYKTTFLYTKNQQKVDEIRGGLDGDKLTNVNFDNSKIKKFVPSFNTDITFYKGIRQIIDWFNYDEKRKIINESSDTYMDFIISNWQKVIDN